MSLSFCTEFQDCHPERSEGSASGLNDKNKQQQILRFAQNDKLLSVCHFVYHLSVILPVILSAAKDLLLVLIRQKQQQILHVVQDDRQRTG